jgi:phosphonate transport system ATP-binding protein
MTFAIEAQDLFRVHSTPEGDAAALQGLTLSVAEGEILTVLGPSGAGKTSFLRILAGLDLPSAGTIRVFGQNLRSLGRGGRARYRSQVVGYLDQHYEQALAPELTARELVGLRLRAEGRDWAPRAEELLRRVGLGEKLGSRPAQLSGGEQQRVAVARSLANQPRLLLADEPTSSLDPKTSVEIMGLMRDVGREHGVPVIVNMHDVELARRFAERIVGMSGGKIVYDGDGAGLTDGVLKSIYE